MGCTQCCKIIPNEQDDPVNKSELEKSISRTSESDGGVVEVQPHNPSRPKQTLVVAFRQKITRSSLVIESVISDDQETTQHSERSISRTPVTSNKSNDHHYNTNSDTLAGSDQRSPHNQTNGNISDIPENNSISIPSDASNRPHLTYDTTNVTSNNLEYVENTKTTGRNRSNTRLQSTYNNVGSVSDGSRSFNDSIVSAASADSETSSVVQSENNKPKFYPPRRTTFNDTSSASEVSELQLEPNEKQVKQDVNKMTVILKNDLQSRCCKLSSPDLHYRGVLSESESELEEVLL